MAQVLLASLKWAEWVLESAPLMAFEGLERSGSNGSGEMSENGSIQRSCWSSAIGSGGTALKQLS